MSKTTEPGNSLAPDEFMVRGKIYKDKPKDEKHPAEESERKGDDMLTPEKTKKADEMQAWYEQQKILHRCAVEGLQATIRNIAREFEYSSGVKPFDEDDVTLRIKEYDSVEEKCSRRGYQWTKESIRKNIRDIAGIRIIADTEADIDLIAAAIRSQPTLVVEEEKDYIRNPKPNGYRSYHMIVSRQIFFKGRNNSVFIEIQIRTEAQDIWSSFEHRARYKHDAELAEVDTKALNRELADAAEALHRFDQVRSRVLRGKTISESSDNGAKKEIPWRPCDELDLID